MSSNLSIISANLEQQELFIFAASIIGIIFGAINALLILRIEVVNNDQEIMAMKDDRKLHSLQ